MGQKRLKLLAGKDIPEEDIYKLQQTKQVLGDVFNDRVHNKGGMDTSDVYQKNVGDALQAIDRAIDVRRDEAQRKKFGEAFRDAVSPSAFGEEHIPVSPSGNGYFMVGDEEVEARLITFIEIHSVDVAGGFQGILKYANVDDAE